MYPVLNCFRIRFFKRLRPMSFLFLCYICVLISDQVYFSQLCCFTFAVYLYFFSWVQTSIDINKSANLLSLVSIFYNRDRSWTEAIHWYEKALEISESDFDGLSENPHHKLYARMAEMYQKGGFGLERDPNRSGELYNEAAESAMNVMQGKLANKYYMLAEEVWAEIDE